MKNFLKHTKKKLQNCTFSLENLFKHVSYPRTETHNKQAILFSEYFRNRGKKIKNHHLKYFLEQFLTTFSHFNRLVFWRFKLIHFTSGRLNIKRISLYQYWILQNCMSCWGYQNFFPRFYFLIWAYPITPRPPK